MLLLSHGSKPELNRTPCDNTPKSFKQNDNLINRVHSCSARETPYTQKLGREWSIHCLMAAGECAGGHPGSTEQVNSQ